MFFSCQERSYCLKLSLLKRMRRAGVSILVLACATHAADTSWYMSSPFICSDPFALQNTYMNGPWFHKYLDIHYLHVSQMNRYVELGKAHYDTILAAQPQPLVFDSHQMSSTDADVIRKQLLAASKDAVIPVTTKAIPYLLSYATPAGGYFGDSFLSYLLSQDQVVKADGKALAEVIVAGGRLDRLLTITVSPGHHAYLIETFIYAVDVGLEHRKYATLSCTYPIKVVYMEFLTNGTSNSKIFRKSIGTRWDQIDVDTETVEQILYETGRDDTYIYLDDTYIYLNGQEPNNRINDAFRIGLYGGPWQIRHQDGSWGTLSAYVSAR